MKRRSRRHAAGALVVAGVLAMVGGCGRGSDPVPASSAPPQDAMRVQPPAAMLERLRIATVETSEIREQFRVSGSVQVDEERVARIGSSVSGRVIEAPVMLGADVRPGQPLARIDSTELAIAQRNFLKAGLDLELVQRAVERARLLVAADVIGSAELQRRENELFSAEAELRTARGNLMALGMSVEAIGRLENTRAISPVSTLVSKLGGTVIERRLTVGQVVQPADALFTVADLSQVWVVSDVPEEQVYGVKVGDPVDVEIPALRDRRLTARVTHVGNTVNPETRTVTVRTTLPNADRSIKPAMLVTMAIREPARRALAVPAAAVVREGAREHVFVPESEGVFRLRPVTLGPETSDGLRPVLSGLAAGERIVVEGAFHLNAERQRQ